MTDDAISTHGTRPVRRGVRPEVLVGATRRLANTDNLIAVLTVVGVTAVAVHTFSILASRLWVYPDSIDYITLAGGIADRGDFANDLFQIRPPGYPLLLAGLFALFGSASPFAIIALQHVLAAATALLTAGIAWTITRRSWYAALAGVLSACGLQSIAYANLALTETAYAFLLTATLLGLARFVVLGRSTALLTGSFLAGAAYLVKPVGIYLLGTCALAALIRVWSDRRAVANRERVDSNADWPPHALGRPETNRRLSFRTRAMRRLALTGFMSVAPALLVVAPWKIANAALHAGDDTNRCLDYVLYLRAIEFDNLDSTTSASLRDIKHTVGEAIQRGALPPGATFRDRATVIQAYESVRGWPFARSTAVMGQAARDVMREHAWTIGINTIRYAAWMLLAPDPVYRFQPGGAQGIDGKRNPDAVIYDVATYAFGPGSWEPTLAEYRQYLPLDPGPRPASAAWTRVALAFHDRADAAPPIIGIADSPYSEWVVFCLVGIVLTAFSRDRGVWLLLLATLGAHLLISAFLGGPQTRYALPVQPILKLGGAWFLVEIARCAALSIRTILPSRLRSRTRTAFERAP